MSVRLCCFQTTTKNKKEEKKWREKQEKSLTNPPQPYQFLTNSIQSRVHIDDIYIYI